MHQKFKKNYLPYNLHYKNGEATILILKTKVLSPQNTLNTNNLKNLKTL